MNGQVPHRRKPTPKYHPSTLGKHQFKENKLYARKPSLVYINSNHHDRKRKFSSKRGKKSQSRQRKARREVLDAVHALERRPFMIVLILALRHAATTVTTIVATTNMPARLHGKDITVKEKTKREMDGKKRH
jgi:hypothetical protein